MLATMEVGKQERELWAGQTVVVCKKVNRTKGAPPHLLMVPYPAHPHITPMLGLAKQIVAHGGVTVTLVSHQKLIDRLVKSESNLSDAIRLFGVPDDLPGFDPPKELPYNPIVLRESLNLGYCMGPYVDKLLQDEDSLQGPTSMITDFMNWWTIDVAVKLGIPRYVLCVSGSASLLQLAYCPGGGYTFAEGEFMKIPGFGPGFQLHQLVGCCRAQNPIKEPFLILWPKSVLESDGVLLNSCLSLEYEVIDALRTTLPPDIPVLPIGPLGLAPEILGSGVSMEGLKLLDDNMVINWLNRQPPFSVLYVNFGTTGLFELQKRHVKELARGLEESGQRFLWVFRAPPDVDENDHELLPPSFEERVKGRGLLLRGWAPQLKILAHPSTGAFLSSCGWNSSIESLASGVPLIGWPSFADQPINCRLMEATLKVAITLPFGKDYFVKAEDFSKAINAILQSEEGTAMRERARKCSSQIAADLAHGGYSYEALSEFANMIKSESFVHPAS